MKAICDAGCKKEFDAEIKTDSFDGLSAENLPDRIEKVYFTCTECGKEYLCFYIDSPTRRLQEDIRKIDKMVKTLSGQALEVYIRASSKRHKKIKNQIAHRMKILKERYNG